MLLLPTAAVGQQKMQATKGRTMKQIIAEEKAKKLVKKAEKEE